jgi:hypothetical protein
MKVITLNTTIFKFVPRFTFNSAILTFDEGLEVQNVVSNNQVTILNTSLFTEGQNYAFTITSNSEIVYKGKIIFLKNGTDIQNYSAQTQDTKRWQ